MESVLNYCPRCGKQDIDTDKHGATGTGICRACGTLFSVLSVRMGQKDIPVAQPVPAPQTKPRSGR